jgi:uncharacterized protein (DUF2267 family)
MNAVELIEDVRKRGGVADDGRAELAIAAVVSVLGGALSGADAEALAMDLPASFAERMRRSAGGAELADVQQLYERVAARGALTLGLAVEESQVVLQVLAEQCSDEALMRVRKHLPADVASLLTPHAAAIDVEPPRRAAPEPALVHTTLASGRVGSEHPLSEARPDRAHEHSVARSRNPHGDRKLSSTRR